MQSISDSRINMLRTVAKLHKDEAPKFGTVPAIPPLFVIYNGYLTDIEKLLGVAFSDAKQAAKTATTLKIALCAAAEKVAMPTGAYAAAIGDETLKSLMQVRASRLMKLKKDRLPILCQAIHDAASAVQAEAAPYSLTKDKLTTLKNAKDAYANASESPRIEHGKVGTANEEVERLIRQATTMLVEQLDRLVSTLDETEPALVSLWHTARKLVRPQRKKTELTLTVLSSDKLPINSAKSLLRNGKDYEAFTDAEGKAMFKPAPPGEVAVMVEAEGFEPFELPKFWLIRGKENSLEVLLERKAAA